MCGNSKSCIDPDKVCDGFSDCAGGEDERTCTALIDDPASVEDVAAVESPSSRIDPASTFTERKHSGRDDGDSSSAAGTTREYRFDQEAVESSIVETTTLYRGAILAESDRRRSERPTNDRGIAMRVEKDAEEAETTRYDAEEEESDKLAMPAVSSREISSNHLRNGLTPGKNDIRATENDRAFPIASIAGAISREEIDNYNDNGYLSVRKNGKWGRLCLSDADAWSVEDLARAACKAITYR